MSNNIQKLCDARSLDLIVPRSGGHQKTASCLLRTPLDVSYAMELVLEIVGVCPRTVVVVVSIICLVEFLKEIWELINL